MSLLISADRKVALTYILLVEVLLYQSSCLFALFRTSGNIVGGGKIEFFCLFIHDFCLALFLAFS